MEISLNEPDTVAILNALETSAHDAERAFGASMARTREVLAFWRGMCLRDDSHDLAEKVLASLEPFVTLREKSIETRSREDEDRLCALELALATVGVFPDQMPESGNIDKYVALVREAVSKLTATTRATHFPDNFRRP